MDQKKNNRKDKEIGDKKAELFIVDVRYDKESGLAVKSFGDNKAENKGEN